MYMRSIGFSVIFADVFRDLFSRDPRLTVP